VKIISWNLLRLTGATVDEVAALIKTHSPDLLLMQETTTHIDCLTDLVGGYYHRSPLPGRVHGLAIWSPTPLPHQPLAVPLPSSSTYHRVCQIMHLRLFSIANVHLSHGQVLNRRQLRRIAAQMPPVAAVLGDYNLLGPALLPGFKDVGPRGVTHRAIKIMPFRLDRCLIRNMECTERTILPRPSSDHQPIMVRLNAVSGAVQRSHLIEAE
jgi:endonuclease/exonuclease/phosphatase (EEP) superfamily protein YafD